jgi:hypothetical protein
MRKTGNYCAYHPISYDGLSQTGLMIPEAVKLEVRKSVDRPGRMG